jgi:hypothetical protein
MFGWKKRERVNFFPQFSLVEHATHTQTHARRRTHARTLNAMLHVVVHVVKELEENNVTQLSLELEPNVSISHFIQTVSQELQIPKNQNFILTIDQQEISPSTQRKLQDFMTENSVIIVKITNQKQTGSYSNQSINQMNEQTNKKYIIVYFMLIVILNKFNHFFLPFRRHWKQPLNMTTNLPKRKPNIRKNHRKVPYTHIHTEIFQTTKKR